MSLQNAIKQSCDTYFYEAARLLGVDRLNETAKKFGLGNVVLGEYYNEKKRRCSFNKMEKTSYWSKLVPRRNFNKWYWTRLYSNNTFAIMFNDSSTCKRRSQNISKINF